MRKLPKGWARKTVDELFDVQLGKMLNEIAKTGASQFPYLTNTNVQWARFRLDALNQMHFSPKEREKFSLKTGDLVLCEGGEVGRCAIWRNDVYPCYFQKTLHRLRPKVPARIISEYMLAYMRFIAGTKLLGDLTSQSSIAHLTREKLLELAVNLPPLPEQQKIADILGTWDEALEKIDALIAAKACRKQALMQQLLTGRLQLQKFKARPWQSVRMEDVLERVFRPAEIDASAILPLVSIRRRLGGLFRRPDVMASEYKTQDLHFLKTGDFVISKRQVAHGAWSIVEAEFDGTLVSKEYAILVNRAPSKLDMRFFAWLAQTPRMVRLSRVASTGVHIEKLIFDPEVFLREKIRVPSDVAEQRAIAAVLDTAGAELRVLQQQRIALDQQKRGLMQQLLTGKVRVKP